MLGLWMRKEKMRQMQMLPTVGKFYIPLINLTLF